MPLIPPGIEQRVRGSTYIEPHPQLDIATVPKLSSRVATSNHAMLLLVVNRIQLFEPVLGSSLLLKKRTLKINSHTITIL